MPHAPLTQLSPRRVCFIKPSALGDVVQSLPVLTALRQRWPRAEFSWVINRSLAPLLDGHPDLHEVLPFDRAARGSARWSNAWRLARTLHARQFDLAIDLQGLLRSGLMTRATGAARRVGFAAAREWAPMFYTDRIDTPAGVEAAVERYWLIAQAFGCSGEPPPARLGLTEALRAWARGHLVSLPRPVLAIHPGAQWQTKRWPPEHFAAVAQQAIDHGGAGVALICGPGEEPLCRQIAGMLRGPVVDLGGRTRLLELAAVLAECDLLLAGDTGPLHLAAALETKVVGLYTCTSPRRARPHGVGQLTVATEVPCAASYLKTCPHLACMAELSPNRVWPVVSAALSAVNQHAKAG